MRDTTTRRGIRTWTIAKSTVPTPRGRSGLACPGVWKLVPAIASATAIADTGHVSAIAPTGISTSRPPPPYPAATRIHHQPRIPHRDSGNSEDLRVHPPACAPQESRVLSLDPAGVSPRARFTLRGKAIPVQRAEGDKLDFIAGAQRNHPSTNRMASPYRRESWGLPLERWPLRGDRKR
jgi:hypothetical protein